MAKVADSYFKIDPWKIVEEGFAPEYAMTAESVFSLGNEYMGVRGYFEEGYSGQRLLGSYFNGVYERRKAAAEGLERMCLLPAISVLQRIGLCQNDR
jgi:maltose phosphorylase